MPGTGELNIKVGADVGQAVSAMAAFTSAVNTATQNITGLNTSINALSQNLSKLTGSAASGSAATKGLSSSFAAAAEGAGIAEAAVAQLGTVIAEVLGPIIAVKAAFDFLKDSVSEFEHAQLEAAKLQNILTNIGRLDVFESLKEKAGELAEKFGTIKSEDVTGVFDQLITYGKLTENQINQLLPVVINFAAKTGQDLPSATSLIEKALEGNGRALKQFGIDMTDGATTAERFGIIMTELAPRVDGAAKAFGETTTGEIKKTKVQIDELKKSIGEELDPIVKAFFEGVEGAIFLLKQQFSFLKAEFNFLATGIRGALDIIKGDYGDIALIGAEQKALEDRNKTEQDWIDIKKNASAFSEDVSTESLQAYNKALKDGKTDEQAKAAQIAFINEQLRQQQALQKSSLQAYSDLAKAGKANSDEGHAALVRAEADSQIVANLVKLKDTRILGFGAGKTNTDDDAKKALDDQISLLEQIKKIRDDLNKPDNKPTHEKQSLAVSFDDAGIAQQSQAGKDAIALIEANLQKAVFTANEGIKEALIAGHKDQAAQIQANLADLQNLTAQEIQKIKFPDLKVSAPHIVDEGGFLSGAGLQSEYDKAVKKLEDIFNKDKTITVKSGVNLDLELNEAKLAGATELQLTALRQILQKRIDDAEKGKATDPVRIGVPSKIDINVDQKELNDQVKKILTEALGKNQTKELEQIASQEFEQVGVAIGDAINGGSKGFQDAIKGFANILASGLKKIGEMYIETGVELVLADKVLKTATTNPALLIVEGIALEALSTVLTNSLKSSSATAFATGAIITGPTLGLVGEAGPEVIFPLDRLNRFVKGVNGGNQNITFTGKISGKHILIAGSRASKSNSLYQ